MVAVCFTAMCFIKQNEINFIKTLHNKKNICIKLLVRVTRFSKLTVKAHKKIKKRLTVITLEV